jgi:heterodisulfide reductase subunit C
MKLTTGLQLLNAIATNGQLSPRALRTRRLLIQHTCQAITEATRPARVEHLVDEDLERCTWCGAWTHSGPSCPRCARNHPPTNGVTS